MSWILDGSRIKAKYLGVPVTGIVIDSRVKYGGEVQYAVKLDEALVLPWGSRSAGDTVLINRSELVE